MCNWFCLYNHDAKDTCLLFIYCVALSFYTLLNVIGLLLVLFLYKVDFTTDDFYIPFKRWCHDLLLILYSFSVTFWLGLRLWLVLLWGCMIKQQYNYNVFTARCSYASAVLAVVILSVCLSVCHTRALWLIQRTYWRYGDIFIPHERVILLVFRHPTVVGGRRPFLPKMGDRSDPPLQKSLTSTSTDFRL